MRDGVIKNQSTQQALRHKKIPLFVAIAILVVLATMRYASYLRPYSTLMENTKVFYYTDYSADPAKEGDTSKEEKAALELAKLFMADLMTESNKRTFRVTQYRDLSIEILPTITMSEETASIYFLKENEIDPNKWIVEISISYKYEGVLSPIGKIENQWIDILDQSSPIGFLMVKDGDLYTLQSRDRSSQN